MGGGPPGVLAFLWNQQLTETVVTDGKLTEELTAKKWRPVGFGAMSKSCYLVCNEACWNLLREASYHGIQDTNIPGNIWELCKGSRANPPALMCLVTKQHESCVLREEDRDWEQREQSLSWVLSLPAAWVPLPSPTASIHNASKQKGDRSSSPGLPSVHMLVLHLCSPAASSQASHLQDVNRRT